MIFLYDVDADLQAIVNEYDSALETERWSEWSDLTVRMPASRLAEVRAARYFSLTDRIYLIEHTVLNGNGTMTVTGRSAGVELEHRTVPHTQRIVGRPHAVMTAILNTLTVGRLLLLRMGNGSSLGTSVPIQVTWGSIGERSRELLESQGLSVEAVRDNGIRLDVIAPEYNGRYIGDRFRNADLSNYEVNESAWRNYAYVAGQGEGTDRVVVEIDLTGGGERRELYVDADDIAQEDLTLTQYQEALTQRGLEKLAESRKVDVITAESSVPFLGEVVRYDSPAVSAWLMCTEREISTEGGVTQVRARLGEPTPTLRRAIRRAI